MPSPLLAITALGLVLRLLVLRMQGTGWLDELFSLHFAGMPFMEGVAFLVHDVHPPLFGVLLHWWISVFGTTIASARSFSIIVGTLTIPAVAWMCGKAGISVRAARMAAFITAVSPILLYHSAEARMYPLLILGTAVAIGAFFDMRTHQNMRSLLRWTFASLLMLLIHVTAVIPFVIMVLWGSVRSMRISRRSFGGAAVLAALPFVVWFMVSFVSRVGSLGTEWQFTGSHIPSPLNVFGAFFAYGVTPWMTPLIIFAALIAVVAALVTVSRASLYKWTLTLIPEQERWFLAVAALTPFLLAIPFGSSTVKYHFVAFPAVVALAAMGLDTLFPQALNLRTKRMAIALYFLVIAVPITMLSVDRRIRWDDAFAFVERHEQAGDLIYLSWFPSELSARQYYHGELPRVSGYPYDKTLSFEDRLVRHAGQIRTTKRMIEDLASATVYSSRVFVVGGSLDITEDPVHAWFVRNGWRMIDRYSSNTFSPTVVLFERTSY